MPLSILFGQKSKAAFTGGIAEVALDASIQESHVLEADITSNPVEDGAEITDHASIKPKRLTITGFITDTPVKYFSGIQETITNVSGSDSRSKTALDNLELLFKTKQPFTVVTGLKSYDNMLFSRIEIPRDRNTGKALRFTAELKEIQLAKFRTTELDESTLSATQNTDKQAPTKKDIGKQATTSPTDGEKTKSTALYDLGKSLGFL